MKKKFQFNLALIVVVFLTSCVTTKNIYMFREAEETSTQRHFAPPPPEIRIKPFDNLYISIKTLDPEINLIFNPSNVGQGGYSSGGTASNFGTPSSQYINGFRVMSDSTITLPILGEIKFVGLTLEEAREHLKIRAEEFLKDPTVEVKFLNYRVNVSGEVRSPGLFYIYEGNLNILDAITMANGISDFADIREVVVKRKNGNDYDSFKVNLTNNSIYSSEVFYLKPNDLVYIPPSNFKRRSANSDTYGRLLGTISVLLLTATFFINN
jgi:polysaccharide export outer membrane protein